MGQALCSGCGKHYVCIAVYETGCCIHRGLVSRFLNNLGLQYWHAVKRTLRYIKGTFKLQLCYQGDDMKLHDYSDVDWASDLDNRKSVTSHVYTLGGRAISWGNKKQTSTTMLQPRQSI